MKRTAVVFCLFALSSGTVRAQESESVLKANFRRVGLDVSNTTVSHASEYRNSSVSALSADGQTVVKGVFDFVAEYTHGEARVNTGIFAEYGKTRLAPYDGVSETNENADKILLYSTYAHKLFKIRSADFGPMLNVEYQTEFTRNDDGYRTRVYRGKAGVTLFDGDIVKDLYIAAVGEYDVTYPEHVGKLAAEAGWRIEYKPEGEKSLTFSTDGYYRRYLSFSRYVGEDLRYDLNVNARMDASLNDTMALGPFLSYRRAHSRHAGVAGSNFTIGLAFTYKDSFDLKP